MISPIAAAMAPMVIIFNVCPKTYNTEIVKHNVNGIVIRTTELAFKERRKIITTTNANSNPIQRLSVTLLIESFTKLA